MEELLYRYYGYKTLKNEQKKIIDEVLAGNDVIGLLPTGYGKSVTFQIPALILDGLTIVITPLIALMNDQVNSLKKKNIASECINSLQTKEEQEKIYDMITNNEVKILYVAAERLKVPRFIEAILKVNVSLVVCDEAHTLLWSEDFRGALGEIPEFIKLLPKRPKMLALTATATKITVDKIVSLLDMKNPDVIAIDCDRTNIFYRVIETHDKERDLFFYCDRRKYLQGIVYCLTVKKVESVYSYLKSLNFNVFKYHGAMEKEEKLYFSNGFQNATSGIMVATNSYGMGIDLPHIRYVVDYDIPASIEDFLQQSGRASRDNEYGECVVFYNEKDIKTVNYFIEHINMPNKTDKELWNIRRDRYKKLDSVISMCLTRKCLHQYCCNYLGIKHNGKCGMCYNCKKIS